MNILSCLLQLPVDHILAVKGNVEGRHQHRHVALLAGGARHFSPRHRIATHIIRIRQSDNTLAVYIYHKEDNDKWYRSPSYAWIPQIGSYELKLFSSNHPPLNKKIDISYNGGNWKIEEISN